jgi:hypothetical protein
MSALRFSLPEEARPAFGPIQTPSGERSGLLAGGPTSKSFEIRPQKLRTRTHSARGRAYFILDAVPWPQKGPVPRCATCGLAIRRTSLLILAAGRKRFCDTGCARGARKAEVVNAA